MGVTQTKGRHHEIGQAIRSARLRKGFSQAECARQTGMSRFHWIRLEQGLHRPTEFAARISELLGVPLSELGESDDDEDEAALARRLMNVVREISRGEAPA